MNNNLPQVGMLIVSTQIGQSQPSQGVSGSSEGHNGSNQGR